MCHSALLLWERCLIQVEAEHHYGLLIIIIYALLVQSKFKTPKTAGSGSGTFGILQFRDSFSADLL